MGNMGFYGQDEWSGPAGPFPATCFKRKFRWKFIIPDVSGSGVASLPPLKSGKPAMSFKEMQAEHLNETIFFPSKPEWKPIQLTLYDIQKTSENPVFSWIKRAYNPKTCSLWKPCIGEFGTVGIKCAQCFLNMYSGCGDIIEQWVFEHAWPQSVEFSDGDMASNELVTCDLTLRYDRAYIGIPTSETSINFPGTIPSYTCTATPSPPLSLVGFESELSMVTFASDVPIPEFISVR